MSPRPLSAAACLHRWKLCLGETDGSGIRADAGRVPLIMVVGFVGDGVDSYSVDTEFKGR